MKIFLPDQWVLANVSVFDKIYEHLGFEQVLSLFWGGGAMSLAFKSTNFQP